MFLLNKVNFSKGEYIYLGLNFQRGMNFFRYSGDREKNTSLTSVGKIPGQVAYFFSLTPGAYDKNAHKMMGL